MKEKIKNFIMSDRFERILFHVLECIVLAMCLMVIFCGVALWWTGGPWLVILPFSILLISAGLGLGLATVWMFRQVF